MNNSKKKGRPSGFMSSKPEGVYLNRQFITSSSLFIGSEATITTPSGKVEGIFRTISKESHIALGAAEKVLDENNARCPSHFLDTFLFKPEQVITMTFKNVECVGQTKSEFETDAQIAEKMGTREMPMKDLEPWDAGQANGTEIDLELDDLSGGWPVHQMFQKNEEDHGVESTYNPTLEGYTIPIQVTDSEDFRNCQAKANQIANAIENNPNYKASIELENEDDEVITRQQGSNGAIYRSKQQESNGKYVPPPKRKTNQNNGKIIRNTTPLSSGSSSQNSPPPPPKEIRAPPIKYPTHNQMAHHSVGGAQLHHPQQHISNVLPQVISSQMMISQHQNLQSSLTSSHGNVPTRSNSHTPPHQFQQGNLGRQGGPRGGGGGGGMSHGNGNGALGKPQAQINGDNKSTGPQQRQHAPRQYQPQERTSTVPTVPSMQQIYPDMKQQEPHISPPQVQVVQNIPLPRQPPLPPPQQQTQQQQQQRPDTSNHLPPNPETLKELQSFSQDFKLATVQQAPAPMPNINGISSHVVVQGGGPSPTVSAQTHIAGEETPHVNAAVATASVAIVSAGAPPPPPIHPMTADASTNVSLSGSTSNASQSNSNSSLNMISASESTQTAASPQIPNKPSPAESPLSDVEKLQNTVAKSTLNPNAKEFVLNPTAKPFQPRSPSTPSASRPHTPQTPSHNSYMPAAISGGPGAPPVPAVMMPVHYISISQQQYPTPPPPQPRLRKIPIRTDAASQMQHAAAVTGQPLLAPAPIQQFLYNPTATPAAHGMNHTAYQPAAVAMAHTAAIRMYQNESGIPPQIQYLTQPSGNGTPAQSPYNPVTVQQSQAPPQSYQATPQQAHTQMSMYCFPAQPTHLMPNVPAAYLQQGPPPPPPHQHVQVLVQHQHPASQGGNPHGPNP